MKRTIATWYTTGAMMRAIGTHDTQVLTWKLILLGCAHRYTNI